MNKIAKHLNRWIRKKRKQFTNIKNKRCDIIRDVLQEDGFGKLAQYGSEGEEANCVPGTGQCSRLVHIGAQLTF